MKTEQAECEYCGKAFERTVSGFKLPQRFCSKACAKYACHKFVHHTLKRRPARREEVGR